MAPQPDTFKELNAPLQDRLGQLIEELSKLEGETAAREVGDLSVETIALEARSLSVLWPTLGIEGKQRLASTICSEIIVPDKDPDAPIEIVFTHSAPPKHEAPIRVGANIDRGEANGYSTENFSEISNPLNSQRHLGLDDRTPLAFEALLSSPES